MRVNRSIPSTTVIPELAYPDPAAAVDWLVAAFGFRVRLRIANHRIQMNVGDGGALVITELAPGAIPGAANGTMIRVEDIDAHYARALAHGAVIHSPPTDYPYGERQYSATDFAGHRWKFTQSIADVDPVSWGGQPEDL